MVDAGLMDHTPVQPKKGLNHNTYATKKTIAQGLLDIALLSANASQLKFILQTSGHPFYTVVLTLIIMSIVLQIVTAVTILVLGLTNLNNESKHYQANLMNNIVVIQIFIITVINVFISTFGSEYSNPESETELLQTKKG